MGHNEAKELSLLEPEAIEAVCSAEVESMNVLQEKNLCGGCSNGDCLSPMSLSLMIQIYINGGLIMSCSELVEAYKSVQDVFIKDLIQCANELKADKWAYFSELGPNSSCPSGGIAPLLLDSEFGVDGNSFLKYSSSIYHTSLSDESELFHTTKSFNFFNTELFKVAFDNRSYKFREFTIDSYVQSDLVSLLCTDREEVGI